MTLGAWVSTRFLAALAAIAIAIACAPGIHAFLPLAVAAGVVLLVLTLIDAVTRPAPGTLTVQRHVPQHLALRSRVTLTYDVENRSRSTIRLGIAETPVRTLRFDADESVAIAPAGQRTSFETTALPVERGSDQLGTLYVWYESRIGLLRRRMRVEATQTIRVYPDLSAVERYGTLHARNRLIEAGLRRIRMRGTGTEFESLREYADGDAFRTIDWKATARRGKLMVTQREVERSQDVLLLLDCGRLMTARIDDQRKLDYAVTAALSLASIASLASDRVGAVAFAREILVARAPRSTAASISALSNALVDVEPRFEEANYARAFSYVRSHLHRRSLIAFFTDVIDPIAQSAVLADVVALAKRHVVVCLFMSDAAVADTLAKDPVDASDAFRTGVAVGLADERRVAASTLERLGVHVIDVPARSLSVAAIDEYLRIKQRALL